MKRDAKQVIRHLHRKLGHEELRTFLDAYGGQRITIPTWELYLDAALDADVREAWIHKQPGTLQAFYREQAELLDCSTKTVERALIRILKGAA